MVWLTALALVVSLVLVVGLLGLIAFQGMATFWPRAIERVTLDDGTTLLGVRSREERVALAAAVSAGDESGEAVVPGEAGGFTTRRLYQVGNRDVSRATFQWAPVERVVSTERPSGVMLVERLEWGVWIGEVRRVLVHDGAERFEPDGEERVAGASGEAVVRVYGSGRADFDRVLRAAHAASVERRREIRRLTEHELGAVNERIDRLRVRERAGELRAERPGAATGMPILAWAGAIVSALAGAFAGVRLARSPAGESGERSRGASALRAGLAALLLSGSVVLLLASALEHPWAGREMTASELAGLREHLGAERASLEGEAEAIQARIAELTAIDALTRVELVDASGNMAIDRRSPDGGPIPLSRVVRFVAANDMSFGAKLGVYVSRWWEFVSTPPREANTAGGVLPVIFGTVVLTLMLSVVVVPLGVVAAIYLREYSRQGVVTSLVRIGVNNLAGVPSIVYGVFGLGFFCYAVGGFIDSGAESPLARAFGDGAVAGVLGWWPIAVIGVLIAASAVSLGMLSIPTPGQGRRGGHAWLRAGAVCGWLLAAGVVVWLVAGSPYFDGFFRARLPSPTFGARGILWAALTLSLLTLPVVIVATEEAIAAVPNSMRQGSYGAGASKWQTIKRIVLPGAAPGVMTGSILAMARGAGEVAPLMIVGAVKFAPEMPVSGSFPFLHPERSFMHLGYHVYDLGFQSPDSEATRPLLWTTTLLLILIVLALNLAAILIRARLRAKLKTSGV